MIKVNPKKTYRVEWLDITSQVNVKLKRPYDKYLTKSFTIGKIRYDKDTMIVINAGNNDNEVCFDAIPIKCIIKIEEII